MNKKIISCLLAVTLMNSCTINEPLIRATYDVQSSETEQVDAAMIATSTVMMSPTPAKTDQSDIRTILSSPCIKIQTTEFINTAVPWAILTVGDLPGILRNDGSITELPYLSGEDGQGQNLYTRNLQISPDGKWLAYQDSHETRLYIEPTSTLTSKEDISDRSVWEHDIEDSFYLKKWISNDKVLLLYKDSSGSGFVHSLVLDPFSGERQDFSLAAMPGYLKYRFGGAAFPTHYYLNGDLVLDPTMKRIVYPRESENGYQSVLFSLETNEVLAAVPFEVSESNDPIWDLKGEDFVIPGMVQVGNEGYEEWFKVARNGEIEKITNFTDYLEFHGSTHLPSRSWDGRYLVFAYQDLTKNAGDWDYIVLSLQSRSLEGFCIKGKNISHYRPVWSMDNKYFVISDVNNGVGDLVLVDVEKKEAFLIGQNMVAIGWIENFESD